LRVQKYFCRRMYRRLRVVRRAAWNRSLWARRLPVQEPLFLRRLPTKRFHLLQRSHGEVEKQTDAPDGDHSRQDEIVAVAGVTRVYDQKAQTRVDGDHLRSD